ncbi:MAG: hypothetical protein K9J13_13500 [Saprospiraceae bacterium]|nr:hypothetical protein [Saprospiraceae bacterium]
MMYRLTIILIFLTTYVFVSNKIVDQDYSDLKYSLDLSLTIPEFRLIENKLNSTEVFTEIENEFGYKNKPLKQSEKNQPKFFIQKIDNYTVVKAYYYNLPDSNVYAIIYEYENIHGLVGGSYLSDTLSIAEIPSEEYLKSEFQKLTKSLTEELGKFKEYENFGLIREWKLKDKTVHLNLTLGNITSRRLRLVICE